MPPSRSFLAPALLSSLLGPVAAAQTRAASERPEAARRIVKVFNFEERDVNVEPVPMNWVRAVHDPPNRDRPGFPRWNEAAFDESVRHAGQWSVKLPTQGGSVSLRLGAGVIAAIPGADYRVSAMVRTQGAAHSRAQLAARFLDARREPISGSEARSAPLVSEGVWSDIAVELRSNFPDAAWIQIDLELLQPDQLATIDPPREGSRRILFEDVRAAAWFDDVVVQQVPRVDLYTASPGGVVVAPEQPTLVARVRDLTGESLSGRIDVHDLDGRLVDRRQFDVAWGGRPAAWRPNLPAFGWYRALLEVTSGEGGGASVCRRGLDFVYAPARTRDIDSERSRFGLIVEDLADQERPLLPAIVSRAQTGRLHLGVWSRATTLDSLQRSSDQLEAMMEALLDDHQTIVFTLGGLPDELIARTRILGDNPVNLLRSDERDWRPYLDRVVSKFGQRVRRWQIGAAGDDYAFWSADAFSDAQRFREILARLSPEPIVTLPWKGTLAVPPTAAAAAALTLTAPPEIGAPGMGPLLRTAPDGADIALLIETPSPSAFGARAPLIELARRAVEAWRFQPAAIVIRQPWSRAPIARDAAEANRRHSTVEDDGSLMPSPELAVMRQLVERLAGRRVVAELPADEGVAGYILEGGDADMLVAWNDHAEPESASIRAYLAQGAVTIYDLFGNSRVVRAADGAHQIPVGESPIFVEGVDVSLARFRAGVRVEPAFVPSTAERHELALIVDNPWPVTITGRLRIGEPSHWRITPRVLTFNVAPGRSQRLPFEAGFGVAEEAGPAAMKIEVELAADRPYPPLTLSPRLDIGLPYLLLSPSYRVETGDNGERDLVVTLQITNIGDRPLSMQAFALAPDFPREQTPISDLAPSDSIMKRFIFRAGGDRLKGASVRVGLIETDGLGRLNKTLRIE